MRLLTKSNARDVNDSILNRLWVLVLSLHIFAKIYRQFCELDEGLRGPLTLRNQAKATRICHEKVWVCLITP